MVSETEKRIEETVLEILENSNMDEVTEFMVRKSASEKLGLDLSDPTRKKFVRQVVNAFLNEQNSREAERKAREEEGEEEAEEEEDEEDDGEKKRKSGNKEYDDEGDLIICRVGFFLLLLFF